MTDKDNKKSLETEMRETCKSCNQNLKCKNQIVCDLCHLNYCRTEEFKHD